MKLLARFANCEYSVSMSLKPQDIVILLKLALKKGLPWSYSSVAKEIFMSASEVHAGVRRAIASRLMDPEGRRPLLIPLEEFLICCVKYVFPPVHGGPTRGLPTAYAAPPLVHELIQIDELPPVWAYPEGQVRGFTFSPLYKSVPDAALADGKLYEMLALVDALRDGRARERNLAREAIKARLRES